MVKQPLFTSLKIPNSLDYLPLCAAYIEHNAKLIGFNAEEIHAVSLALEEAVSNLIQFAYTPGHNDSIEVNCWQTPLGIEIIIKDKGMPFDYENELDYDPDTLELDDLRGLGMYLIKKAVDEVIFTNRGSEGRETHLIKFITECPIGDMLGNDREEEKKEISRQRDIRFDVRKLAENENIEVSRAIYRIYGYNYFNEHAYYPDRISRLIESGNLDTIAAVTEDGKFAGTCAIYRDNIDARLGELEQAVVLPEYRGNHCMEQLLHLLLEIAREKKMLGIYAKSETSEVYAQRALHRRETRDCAILLGFTSRLVKEKNGMAQRGSMIYTYLPLEGDIAKKIFVPEHHLNIVKEVFANIGYEREYSQPPRGKKPWHDESELDIRYFYNTSTAVIKVARLGKDIISKLKNAKKEVKLKKFAVIYLYLNLENPFTPVYFAKIENLDFFFAGVMPHEKYGDSIILQYLNNIDIDVHKLVFYSEFAQKLGKYIEQCRTQNPLKLLINAGESDKLEFKSTIRLNLSSNQKDSRMGYAILKSVAAFLNSDGGTLLIGVKDNGNILGMEIENFANDDKYLLHFTNLMQNNIGIKNMQYVHYDLVEIENKKILKVECEPASMPLYLKIESVEAFYIRSGPASKKLPVSAAVSYINEHFQNR